MMRAGLAATRTDLRDLANRVGTLERRYARLEGLIKGPGLFPSPDARQGEIDPAWRRGDVLLLAVSDQECSMGR